MSRWIVVQEVLNLNKDLEVINSQTHFVGFIMLLWVVKEVLNWIKKWVYKVHKTKFRSKVNKKL